MIGSPVISATDSAAPPRASPSSLESTTPVKATPSWKACAVSTAAWPIIASMTKSTSSGRMASRMSAACCMRLTSTASRPAVSTMTTSYCFARACSMPIRETATGSPKERVPSPEPSTASWPPMLPRSGAKTGTPARSPVTSSWVTALGRCRSAATSSGVCPWSLSHLPSLPAKVVLPDPCRPASMITVGGCLASVSCRVCPPRIATSSSCTILTTCWAGLSAWLTSAPSARSRTRPVKRLTTGSATSASSSASRMSRTVALTSDSDRRPLPRRFLKVAVSRSDRDANTRQGYPLPRSAADSAVHAGMPSGSSRRSATPPVGRVGPTGRTDPGQRPSRRGPRRSVPAR